MIARLDYVVENGATGGCQKSTEISSHKLPKMMTIRKYENELKMSGLLRIGN